MLSVSSKAGIYFTISWNAECWGSAVILCSLWTYITVTFTSTHLMQQYIITTQWLTDCYFINQLNVTPLVSLHIQAYATATDTVQSFQNLVQHFTCNIRSLLCSECLVSVCGTAWLCITELILKVPWLNRLTEVYWQLLAYTVWVSHRASPTDCADVKQLAIKSLTHYKDMRSSAAPAKKTTDLSFSRVASVYLLC